MPLLGAFVYGGAIAVVELVDADGAGDGLGDLVLAGPDVGQIHFVAVFIRSERVAGEIDVDTSGNRVGHNEHR